MGICGSTLKSEWGKREGASGESGLSILEVLITTVVVSIGFTALLQFLLFALRMEIRNEQVFTGAIDQWNRSQEVRSSALECDGEKVSLGGIEVNLRRFEIERKAEDESRRWEVLATCRAGLHSD